MDKVFIRANERATFERYLTLFSFFHRVMLESWQDLAKRFEKEMPIYQVKDIEMEDTKDKVIINLYDLKNNYHNRLSLSLNKKNRLLKNLGYPQEIISRLSRSLIEAIQDYFIAYQNACTLLQLNGQLEGGKFSVVFDLVKETAHDTLFGTTYHLPFYSAYGKICIRSNDKMDIFYYDLINRQLGIMEEIKAGANEQTPWYRDLPSKKERFVPLPIRFQEKILKSLNSMEPLEVPALFQKCLEENSRILYKKNQKEEFYPLDSFWGPFLGEKYFELDFTPKEKKEEKSEDFLEFIGAKNTEISTKNSDKIRESIKEILINLKTNGVVLEDSKKVKVTEVMYFCQITPERKEIDQFFFDPEIIKNCDLSRIDFTNADIRNAYLADTNVKLDLSKVYDASIEGANLKNVPLAGQMLDGINADGANLQGTYITVCLDDCSIKDAKFGPDARFLLGFAIVSDELLEQMGISIETEENKEVRMK